MCMQDLAIARRTYKKVTVAEPGVVLSLDRNNQRIGIRVGCGFVGPGGAGFSITIQPDSGASASVLYTFAGITGTSEFSYTGPPQWAIDYRGDPALCIDGVNVSPGDSNVVVIETLLEPDLAKAVASELANAIPRK